MYHSSASGGSSRVKLNNVLEATYSAVFAAVKAVNIINTVIAPPRPGIPDCSAAITKAELDKIFVLLEAVQVIGRLSLFHSTFKQTRSPDTKYVTPAMIGSFVAENCSASVAGPRGVKEAMRPPDVLLRVCHLEDIRFARVASGGISLSMNESSSGCGFEDLRASRAVAAGISTPMN
jgi:hypothetical protein